MKTLDELMADKIYELVNYMLAKKIKPDIKLDKVTSLTESDIKNYEKTATEKLNEFKELKTIDITKFSQNSDEGKTIQLCWFDHYFGAFEKLESYIKKPNKIEHKYLYFYFEKAREFAAQKCFPKGK